MWSPDGYHILLVADFQIRMTVWSLKARSAIYVRGPKHAERGLAFAPDGSKLVVAEVGTPRREPCSLLASPSSAFDKPCCLPPV